MGTAPIAVALDAQEIELLRDWAWQTQDVVSTLKIGLETFYRNGAEAIEVVRESGCDLFLDVKLHDIPNTVAGAAAALSRYAPKYLTVHASGGPEMVRAACEELPETLVAAVTVLTSLDDQALAEVGICTPAQDTVLRQAALAVAAGARAIVCSPHEVARVRAEVGSGIILITPGVRPAGSAPGDQKRVMTPVEALDCGADLLVIGRPITDSPNLKQAADAIAREIGSA
ncbi:MAG: orotidine-5'-phosphate decarboxylase [Candidatus Nanopelagicales bacterium]|jgi:orotidine-5'-phosphate decarboxylase|nr:orotidine-5'-phosphate decarboxylase [Candidatus Nanopelagicales bacterium]